MMWRGEKSCRYRESNGDPSTAQSVDQRFSADVPREFGGRSKRSEKKLNKIVEIHDQHHFLKITVIRIFSY
jgi:hypothetical protein